MASADQNGIGDEACDVCGRTILAGEQTREYLTTDAERRSVCALCRPRAEAAGWISAERAAELPPARERERRGGGPLRRLLRRREAPRQPVVPAPVRERIAQPAPERAAASTRGAGAGEDGRRERARAVPQSPERRMRRALEAFNESEHRRTVAGLLRSLGEPSVCVATSAHSPAEVRVTVAWELSWYQWEVDLDAGDTPVREFAKGAEPDELEERDRAWNARAIDDGELRLGLRSRRAAAKEGEKG